MHQYDLNIILNPNLNEAQLQGEKDAINTQIERVQGTVTEVDEIGIRRLAYPIQKLTEGYYLFYTLQLPAEAPKALEGGLRLRDNIMRALVVRDRPDWHTQKPKAPAAEAEATPA